MFSFGTAQGSRLDIKASGRPRGDVDVGAELHRRLSIERRRHFELYNEGAGLAELLLNGIEMIAAVHGRFV